MLFFNIAKIQYFSINSEKIIIFKELIPEITCKIRNWLKPSILFPLLQIPSVPPDIGEIEAQVGGHQQRIEHIEPDYDVVAVQRLVDDAEEVAQNHQRHEEGTFTNYHFRPQRFGDGHRPADRETQ